MLANPLNWPEFLCSRLDSRCLGVHVATTGGCQPIIADVRLETPYIDIEKSISIIDRNFDIAFMSSISIIYGNTTYDVFSGMKSSTTWNGNAIAQSPRKFRDISNTYNIRFIMVYRTIIDLILHLFITCYDLCQLPFSLKKKPFRHNGSTVIGKMTLMCRGCPDLNKRRGRFWDNSGLSCRLNRLYKATGEEMVSLCLLIRLIGVCTDRDQPQFLCSCSDWRYLEVHVATAGGWLTHYHPHEVRNSIYRYKKIHIDYWSKFLSRFILARADQGSVKALCQYRLAMGSIKVATRQL